MDRSHGGRVEHEAVPLDDRGRLPRNYTGRPVVAALPGVFASGKTIMLSSSGVDPSTGKKFITFGFDDGSDMTFIGDYEVHANAAGSTPATEQARRGARRPRGDARAPQGQACRISDELEAEVSDAASRFRFAWSRFWFGFTETLWMLLGENRRRYPRCAYGNFACPNGCQDEVELDA